nr:universal stress protein [uncultured Dethiosulfovibrio sp.]
MFKRIFYPTDLSERSGRDLKWVATNLSDPSGEMVVAHRVGISVGTDVPELVSQIQIALDEFCEANIPPETAYKAFVEAGSYGEVLPSIAQREDCSLAVVATSPRSSILPIVQSLAIPQLILRWEAPPVIPGNLLNSVVVATNLEQERSNQVIMALRDLLEKNNRKPPITLIHGVPMADPSSAHLLFNQASEAMEMARQEVESWNGEAHSKLVGGQTEEELPKLVRELNTSLLVIGLPIKTDIWQLILGNTAEALVDRTACPVLVVPTN